MFDWKIPQVWNINDAYIEHESGKKKKKICSIFKTKLHVVGYSSPINKILPKKKTIKTYLYSKRST